MKIIIHIGPHKTGSTYLQENLFMNRQVLRENGILYPDDDTWLADTGHHKVAEIDQLDYFINSINTNYLQESNIHSLVISSENFDRWSNVHVKKFFESVLAPIHVVYFYRKSPSKYYSFWQEKVKHGFGLEFSHFLVSEIANSHSSKIVNPSIILDEWFFIHERIEFSIFDYDHIQRNSENIVSEFMRGIFGAPYNLKLSPELINKSFSLERAELLRVINQMHRLRGREHFLKLRNAYMKAIHINPDLPKLYEAINEQTNTLGVLQNFANFNVLHENFESQFAPYFKTPISVSSDNYGIKIPSSNWILGHENLLNSFYDQVFQIMRD